MSKGTGEHFSVSPCILWTTVISTNNYHHNPKVFFEFQNDDVRASLVAQWLRICLLMQGTRVRALVWEDPTCCRAAGPVSHNY